MLFSLFSMNKNMHKETPPYVVIQECEFIQECVLISNNKRNANIQPRDFAMTTPSAEAGVVLQVMRLFCRVWSARLLPGTPRLLPPTTAVPPKAPQGAQKGSHMVALHPGGPEPSTAATGAPAFQTRCLVTLQARGERTVTREWHFTSADTRADGVRAQAALARASGQRALYPPPEMCGHHCLPSNTVQTPEVGGQGGRPRERAETERWAAVLENTLKGVAPHKPVTKAQNRVIKGMSV